MMRRRWRRVTTHRITHKGFYATKTHHIPHPNGINHTYKNLLWLGSNRAGDPYFVAKGQMSTKSELEKAHAALTAAKLKSAAAGDRLAAANLEATNASYAYASARVGVRAARAGVAQLIRERAML